MIPDIPWYITAIILGANIAAAVGVWRIVATAAGRSGLTAAAARKVRIGSAIFLFGWLGAALLLAPDPASLAARDRFYLTPLIPLFALGSAIVLLAAVGALPGAPPYARRGVAPGDPRHPALPGGRRHLPRAPGMGPAPGPLRPARGMG